MWGMYSFVHHSPKLSPKPQLSSDNAWFQLDKLNDIQTPVICSAEAPPVFNAKPWTPRFLKAIKSSILSEKWGPVTYLAEFWLKKQRLKQKYLTFQVIGIPCRMRYTSNPIRRTALSRRWNDASAETYWLPVKKKSSWW